MRRNLHHIFTKDASGYQRVLGICSIVENEVLAKIGLVLCAEETLVTRSRIGGDNTHTGLEALTNGFAGFFDNTGQFVAEERRRRNHPGMVSLLPDFEIRPASQRHLHADQKVL